MIFDGNKLAVEILARTKAHAAQLPHPPKIAAIAVAETPATRSYLSIKQRRAVEAGCEFSAEIFPVNASALEVRLAIDSSEADAVVVQLPLPLDMNVRALCDAIPLEKDADVLSDAARMRFEAGEPDALIPPVAGAIAEIFSAADIDSAGKTAVVIGAGWLVGRPCLTLLTHLGADVVHLANERGALSALSDADIIVSGVGSPHFIQPGMLKEGAILIDAGTSELGGKLAGDADPRCAEKCALFTPVPGGVGPIAVAKLFENTIALAERRP